MSDNNYQDWKELGWKQLQSDLDKELPVRRSFPVGANHIAWMAAAIIIGFLYFQNYSLNQQLLDNRQEMAVLNNRLDLSEMNVRVSNDLQAFGAELDQASGLSQSEVIHTAHHKNVSTTKPTAADSGADPVLAGKEIDLVSERDPKLVATQETPIQHTQSEAKIYEERFVKTISEELNGPSDINLDAPIDLTKKEYQAIPAKKTKGLYAFVNTRSDVQMYGLMLGMFTSFDINEKFNIQAGLGYVWSKNDYAIQATQIDEVVLTNQITGARNIQRIEYPTRIVVDNLHYLQIPVSINYQLTPRLNLGVGIEGRFLINNYYSAGPGKDYNLRVTPYTDQNSGKLGQPHDYDLRKYALGATGRMEYRLNERYGIVARHYMGLINISGDKVYNARNEIRNSSFNAGIKMYF